MCPSRTAFGTGRAVLGHAVIRATRQARKTAGQLAKKRSEQPNNPPLFKPSCTPADAKIQRRPDTRARTARPPSLTDPHLDLRSGWLRQVHPDQLLAGDQRVHQRLAFPG